MVLGTYDLPRALSQGIGLVTKRPMADIPLDVSESPMKSSMKLDATIERSMNNLEELELPLPDPMIVVAPQLQVEAPVGGQNLDVAPHWQRTSNKITLIIMYTLLDIGVMWVSFCLALTFGVTAWFVAKGSPFLATFKEAVKVLGVAKGFSLGEVAVATVVLYAIYWSVMKILVGGTIAGQFRRRASTYSH